MTIVIKTSASKGLTYRRPRHSAFLSWPGSEPILNTITLDDSLEYSLEIMLTHKKSKNF